MPEIDIEEVKKRAQKKKDEVQTITSQVIEGKTYFYSKYLDKHFSDYGEANAAESRQRQIDEYKKQGRNENGQTAEDAEKSKKIKALTARKEKAIEEVRAIDQEIAQVKRGEVKEEKKKK
jgi:hypothetical protein